jgi:hypothetical protein
MTPLPLDQIGLHWRQYTSALWWLGLVYRRPHQFREHLQRLPRYRALITGALLWFHTLPYVFLFCLLVRLALFGFGLVESLKPLPNDPNGVLTFHIREIAHGIAFGITFGIAGGIAIGLIVGFFGGITFGIISGIVFEIAVGIYGEITVGIALGMTGGIAVGMAVGNIFGISYGTIGGIAGGVIMGNIYGITVKTIGGIAFGIASGFAFGIAIGIAIGTTVKISTSIAIGIVGGIIVGVAFGITAGISFGVAFGIVALRAFYHIIHPLFIWPKLRGSWYPYHPVAWDDLCALPFPGLDRLLVAYVEQDPAARQQEIERLIDNYPSQRMAALRASAQSITREAAKEQQLSRLDLIIARLPAGDEGFLAWTPQVRDLVGGIAQLQRRLDTQERPFLRETTAAWLCEKIKNFQGQVSGFPAPLGEEFRQAARQWLALAKKQYSDTEADLAREPTPQVFRAGYPVDRHLEAFVPRDGVLRELERQITLSTGCPGLILYARRRMGKSTLLKNLDGFLPKSMHVVTVSMQPARAFTLLESLLDLIMQAVRNVWPEPERPVIKPVHLTSFFNFLNDCNQRLATKGERLLLALDEYEILDPKLGEGVFTENLLATLRESIQSHRQIIWVFAGSHALAELTHAPWSSYLVSARTLIVPPFTEAETRLLLTEPLKYSPLWDKDDPKRPRFDPAFWGKGGIERIHTEAGGWPHFVQLLAEIAVNLCNDSGQDHADAALLEKAMNKAVEVDDALLQQLLLPENASPEEWEYLSGFRSRDTQPPPEDEAVHQALRWRLLVVPTNGEWCLRVPLMQRWLRERYIDYYPRQRLAALRAETSISSSLNLWV